MNGDKSARAIDPLVTAPLRLQPNVLKKETSALVGALGERQFSSDEAHLTCRRSIEKDGGCGRYKIRGIILIIGNATAANEAK